VRADPEPFGDSLKSAGGFQHHAAGLVVGKTLGQVIHPRGIAVTLRDRSSA
jgi:hypothetical protein